MKHQEIKYDNKYLSAIASGIRNKKKKQSLCDELESHILDKADYYEEIGYTKEEAMQKATEDMGNPNEVIISMNRLHYSDWYEDPLSFDCIILSILQIIVIFFYSKYLVYGQYGAVHYIHKDFISLLFLAFNFYVIYRAKKEQNKPVLLIESGVLLFQLFYNPYQPLFYGVASIIDGYSSNYADYIFSYRFISDQTFDILNTASIVLVSIMLCYCIISAVLVHLQEKGKKVIAQWQILSVIGATGLILLGANFVFISTSTLVAYTQKDAKVERSENLRLSLIEYFTENEIQRKGYTINEMKANLIDYDLLNDYGVEADEVFVTHISSRYMIEGNWLIPKWGSSDWLDLGDLIRRRDYGWYKIHGLTYGYTDECDEWHIYIEDTAVVFDSYYKVHIIPSEFYDYNYEAGESDFYLNKAETFFDTINSNNPYCHSEDFDFINKKLTIDEFLKSDLSQKAVDIVIGKKNIYFEFKLENGDVGSLAFNKDSGIYKKFYIEDPNDVESVWW